LKSKIFKIAPVKVIIAVLKNPEEFGVVTGRHKPGPSLREIITVQYEYERNV